MKKEATFFPPLRKTVTVATDTANNILINGNEFLSYCSNKFKHLDIIFMLSLEDDLSLTFNKELTKHQVHFLQWHIMLYLTEIQQ